ncbi:hypothetical protein HYT23_01655 [Candidatus Pacearchaeota archaeon]|nr:hypothetical protein [Candidatus Pacearchaeota archaeon]
MGKKKHQARIEDLFNKSPVVSFNSIKNIIKNKKNIRQYTKQFIRNQISNKKIKRLAKGYYTKHDNIVLSVFCFKPAYFGLQDALSIQNLWEQETIPVIVTIRNVRPGIRKILGLNVLIRRINKKYFFGFEYKEDGGFFFPVSDIEKTFIDMVYFRQNIDKESLIEFRKRMNKNKLKSYLKIYPKLIKKRVLNALEKR